MYRCIIIVITSIKNALKYIINTIVKVTKYIILSPFYLLHAVFLMIKENAKKVSKIYYSAISIEDNQDETISKETKQKIHLQENQGNNKPEKSDGEDIDNNSIKIKANLYENKRKTLKELHENFTRYAAGQISLESYTDYVIPLDEIKPLYSLSVESPVKVKKEFSLEHNFCQEELSYIKKHRFVNHGCRYLFDMGVVHYISRDDTPLIETIYICENSKVHYTFVNVEQLVCLLESYAGDIVKGLRITKEEEKYLPCVLSLLRNSHSGNLFDKYFLTTLYEQKSKKYIRVIMINRLSITFNEDNSQSLINIHKIAEMFFAEIINFCEYRKRNSDFANEKIDRAIVSKGIIDIIQNIFN